MVWKPIELPKREGHDFSKEKTLLGVLVRKEKGQYEGNNYIIKKDDGNEVMVWGKAALQLLMEQVPDGKRVKIEFVGMQKNPKTLRTFENYTVNIDE